MRKPHILVADPEYIIAMEAERILHDLLDCDVTIINPHRCGERTVSEWADYGLVMLDTGICLGEIQAIAERLRQQGIPMAFTTAHQAFAHGVPGFPDTPVLAKPYGPEQFAAAILPLLVPRGEEAAQGEIGLSVIAAKPGSGP